MAYRSLLFLSLLILSTAWGEGIAVPFPVHEGDRIERVILPKRQYLRPVDDERFYRGNLPETAFHDFRRLRGRHGTIYLIDLGRDGKYFDGLPYDTLEIHTRLKHFRLALADEKMAKREDNRIVAVDRSRVQFTPGMKGLDLQRLKYAVILTEEPLRAVELLFKKRIPPRRSAKPDRAVWAWQTGRVNPSRLRRLGIRRIYLQTGPGFPRTLEAILREGGIEIYALDGSPGDIDHIDRLLSKFRKLPLKHIRGIQLDVEPYLLEEYRADPAGVLQRYLRFLHRMKNWCHRHRLRFSVALPFWFGTLERDGRPLFPRILREVDEAVLMSYRSDPREVLRISADALRWGERMGRRIDIGVELKPLPSEQHIVYRVGAAGPCITRRFFHLECRELKPLRRYRLSGSVMSFYGKKGALKTLLESRVPYRSFGGFVFHDESMLELFESVVK